MKTIFKGSNGMILKKKILRYPENPKFQINCSYETNIDRIGQQANKTVQVGQILIDGAMGADTYLIAVVK
jgi:hypothetical protein